MQGPPPQIKPKDLDDYLEQLSKGVFQAGISWRVVDAKWPGIKAAFKDFDTERVARMSDRDIDKLAQDPQMIRSRPKTVTTKAASAAARRQNAPTDQKPNSSMSTPPMDAPATMPRLVSDAESARSVPRASGTCSVSSVVFEAKRAPITADSARFRIAVTRSGNVRLVWRARMVPEMSTLPPTTHLCPIRDPRR